MARREIFKLIESGLLIEGDKLEFRHPKMDLLAVVTVSRLGKLVSQDGSEFRTPTSAAKKFNNGRPINGWRAWREIESKCSLDELWIKSRKVPYSK